MWSSIKNLFTRTADTFTTIVNTVDDSASDIGETISRQAALVNATHAMNCIRELEQLEFDKAAVEQMDDFFASRRDKRKQR